jgi:translocation and assembly module TamB
MAEEEAETTETTLRRRPWRIAVLALAGIAATLLFVALVGIVLYRFGYADAYVKDAFTARLSEMGIAFTAESFELRASPLELHIREGVFNDKLTGEKLFYIREAHLGMTVTDLFALRTTREISIDTTDITGAEVWIKFDENGRSNFSNLKVVEDERGSAVNFRYESVKFALRESVVHLGDLKREISGDAKNIVFLLSPVARDAEGDPLRFSFDLTSTDSNFAYDEKTVEDIDIRAQGIADDKGADIRRFELATPIGKSTLTGRLEDWNDPKYDLDIETTVDMTQASAIFMTGTQLTGVGNFKGKVTGQGETYRIEGTADSEAMRLDGVYLKAVNVAATVAGTNSNYEANGRAIAELLTYDDFRVDWLKMAGNVRGTGTDLRWFGELEAAAARAGNLSLGGLFLKDARAELRDREIIAEAGSGRTQRFGIGDMEFEALAARNLRFTQRNGAIDLSAPNATARSFKTEDYSLSGVTGSNIRVKNAGRRTDVDIDGLRSATGTLGDTKLRGLKADSFKLTDVPDSTTLSARNFRAEGVDAGDMRIDGLVAPQVDLRNTGAETVVYSDTVRVAKVDTDSAILGSLNVGGVRLTIRQGRVEARSNDIDAGTVAIKKSDAIANGGELQAVTFARPVYILEPSGRYRATADMSIGGGTLGSVTLGAARARVEASNDRVAVNDVTAAVMDGQFTGNAVFGLNQRVQSRVTGSFSDLDVARLLALPLGRVTPIDGQTTGTVDLTFAGTNFGTANGVIDANVVANAGGDSGAIPISGPIKLTATNGLFNVDVADLRSDNSRINATGRLDLRGDATDLAVTVRSTEAGEIDRMMRVLGVSQDFEQQLDSMQVQFAGNLSFDGKVTGNASALTIAGPLAVDRLTMRGRELGRVSTDILVAPNVTELRNGRLTEAGGGNATFSVVIPEAGINNTTVEATLTNINAGNLLAALPVELPERIRDFTGNTSGRVDIRGLPNAATGSIDLNAESGTLAGQAFDDLVVKAGFAGTRVQIERADMRIGAGSLSAKGSIDHASEDFDLELSGASVPIALVTALLPPSESIPVMTGDVTFNAKASGVYSRTQTYNVTFSGSAPEVTVTDSSLGRVEFSGQTVDRRLTAQLTASLNGQPQVINATIDLGSDRMPITATTELNQSPLTPFLSFIPQLKGVPITGTGTGRVQLSGDLGVLNDQGQRVTSWTNLTGTAEFSELSLQIKDTPLSAAEPVVIRFDPQRIEFVRARFAGSGSNMTISGTKALAAGVDNNMSIEGRVNLTLLNLATRDTFFAGFADASMRLFGPNSNPRLTGIANVVNGSVATFLGSDRYTMDRVQARIIFTSDQVELEQATGYLGGGRFTASGGGILGSGRGQTLFDSLAMQSFRFSLDGNNVTVPLPKDFITTGDAQLEVTGIRRSPAENIEMAITGRVLARRSLYSKDIDLANVVSSRRDPVLAAGGGGMAAPRFDIVIEGRDALVVRNNIADLTASVSLVLTGDANNPRVTGRITATGGTIMFRKDRYELQRGVLEFPPETNIDPIVNLQGETEIAGYQVFVTYSGPLRDSEQATMTVRSSPALPQADVISLITTGSLTNTTGGIPTFAQTGINTAAEIVTDAIINDPARRATDRLFGLNVFEIDPIIAGTQANPGARLTVGRQINNNLRVTYSTNLSQDQNQVLAFEYRVSNKLSLVAQYEQRSLTNVTRDRDNFSFEVRFRKRF